MTTHRRLQPPTQGSPVNGGDDQFFRCLEFLHQVGQPGILDRFVKFSNIGAGNKCPACADQYRSPG